MEQFVEHEHFFNAFVPKSTILSKHCISEYRCYRIHRYVRWYKRKLNWVEQLQSHIWGRASLYMEKCINISPYMRRPLVINDFATAPLSISFDKKENQIFLIYKHPFFSKQPAVPAASPGRRPECRCPARRAACRPRWRACPACRPARRPACSRWRATRGWPACRPTRCSSSWRPATSSSSSNNSSSSSSTRRRSRWWRPWRRGSSIRLPRHRRPGENFLTSVADLWNFGTVRIRIRGSILLSNGSGSGSCFIS